MNQKENKGFSDKTARTIITSAGKIITAGINAIAAVARHKKEPEPTLFDNIINRIKNNKKLCFVLIFGTSVIAIGKFTNAIVKIKEEISSVFG